MRDFAQLSGGQKQTVLIARVLAQEPANLFPDDPTSNLHMKHQLDIMAIHDLNLADRFSDNLYIKIF
jgi:iron complex transport system ATP-binding protein